MSTLKHNKIDAISNEKIDDIFSRYDRLKAFYFNNGAYNDFLRNAAQLGIKVESIKPLRTPINRSANFYVNKILAGATVQVGEDKEELRQSLSRVYKWSNFNQKKNEYSLDLSLLGDFFLKVRGDESKVWWEKIDPSFVTDMKIDIRGYIRSIRIDVPIDPEEHNGNSMFTEYWEEEEDGFGYVATWEHKKDRYTKLSDLDNPKDMYTLAEYGITFIPIVYAGFNSFDVRAFGCVTHALDKIDELNRMATRLHELLFRFNKPYHAAITSGLDKEGRPTPKKMKVVNLVNKPEEEQDQYIDLDRTILDLTGYDSIQDLGTNIDYADALAILTSMADEISYDLPELKINSINTRDLAGAGESIQLIMDAAVHNAKTARNNISQALIRAGEMAISIGIYFGVFDKSLGKYENGDYEHVIKCDDIFGLNALQKANLIKTLKDAGMSTKFALRQAEFSEEEISKEIADKNEEQARENIGLANGLLNNPLFNTG